MQPHNLLGAVSIGLYRGFASVHRLEPSHKARLRKESTFLSHASRRTELLNGVRVLAIERPGEIAVINLLVKAGSSVIQEDKAGLANLTAQSVCFANAKLPLQRWKDELEFLQARIEIHLTTDSTVFQAQVPSSNVEAVLALFARLVVHPMYQQEGVDRIKSELHSSKLTVFEPRAMARLYLRRVAFRTNWLCPHRVGNPGIGQRFAHRRS